MTKADFLRAFEAQKEHATDLRLLYMERRRKQKSSAPTVTSEQVHHEPDISITGPHLDDEPELHFSTHRL